ncbi:aconitate hydratase [Halobacillus karajensis]|uniref:aconitate hydratase n=1 Tax=Halobacillus karajensis TaxID=195088 RepID=A0A024P435_9BACI|nr:aconitate hydratase [Halobacillus karajensis]CDQ18678.1 2,3-dimethylmalate dehydratase large subunit [Halobacillus karajensis]CDQ23250.1 2,3-dimethylmalate dehydratase large subunit [Halobacillus karajensis]CDQ26732.1 2,3-dimethylmalate dehydratase large subunit [Halobacillus karajensis]
MGYNVTQKLIKDHLVEGEMMPGSEIGLKIDQTLTQDATGTMVMLELEAMGIDQAKTEASAQYVDHNLIQEDSKNPDDHLFLESAAKRFGLHFSRPGNGVSHPVHMQRLAKPGKTLLGSDSHTCANGCMGMLAMGAGGIDVALAIAGEPFYVKMPKVWGVKVTGELPDWVSAKDAILEMLRRHGVKGGVNHVFEYYGPGLKNLTAMDRHVIANMGAELGATGTVFPSDEETKRFMKLQGREDEWIELLADKDASYDVHDELNLSTLGPMVAKPSSPGNVVPIEEIEGEPIYQSYIGSSANPGYRDFAIASKIVEGRHIADGVSFDLNPTSRQMLIDLSQEGHIANFLQAGGRLHQAGCNGCIGMGQAPATGRNSLRTTPRNFPGRSGTKEDSVFLCSPETAAVSALTGRITDPRKSDFDFPKVKDLDNPTVDTRLLDEPLPLEEAKKVELVKGPNVASIPEMDELPNDMELPILLKMGDDISTDEILAGGARVLPYRSNLPEISKFTFEIVDETYHDRAMKVRDEGGHAVVAGVNYGQGSSREHAALAPKYLGLRVAIVEDFARIHWQNLANFGVLPLTFTDPSDLKELEQGDVLVFKGLRDKIKQSPHIEVEVKGKDKTLKLEHALSDRQIEIMQMGGLINWIKNRLEE